MKKNIISIFLVLFTVIISFAQEVQIGTGTNKDQKTPIYPPFGYSYSQSIYLASEINGTGKITAIKWYYSGVTKLQSTQNLRIYIGHTNKSQFSSNNDWITIDPTKPSYQGTFPITTTTGWKTITLTTPFDYDGVSNIYIAANDNFDNINIAPGDFGDRFYNTQVNGKRSLAIWGDSSINIANPPKAEYTGGFVDYVPNIILVGITEACKNPSNLIVSNVDTNSATLTWTNPTPAPAMGTEYYYSTSSTNPNSGTLPSGSVTSGTTANLVSLQPNTTYYVWIRSKCGNNDFSSWTSFNTFTTECLAVNYIFENFDSVTPNALPPCWKQIARGPGLSSGARVGTYEYEYNISPNNIAEVYSGESPNSADVILVSPRLSNLGDGTHRLKVYLKGNGEFVQIGTLDKNDNTGKFTIYKTIPILAQDKYWKEYEIDFKDYRGTDKFIGIRSVYYPESTWTFVDVENFLWEKNPTCPDVTTLRVTASTPNSGTVEWNSIVVPQYQVGYGLSTETFPSESNIFPAISSTIQNIPNLQPNTLYNVWIRSVCANNDNGSWSEPVEFRTPCLPEPQIGFFENFENVTTPSLPNCWSKIISGPTPTPFSTVDTNQFTDILPQPNKAVSLYNYTTKTDAYKVILVTPKLSTLQLGTYRLKFLAKHLEYPASLEIGTLDNNTDYGNFNVIQSNELTNTTKEYTVNFNGYTGPDTFIGIRLIPSEMYCTAVLDNIVWELIPVCPDVSDITITEPTVDGATVSWIGDGTVESYEVSTVLPENKDPNTGTIVKTTLETVNLTGLNSQTTYNVWVRSICTGNDKGSWIGPVAFTTGCAAVETFIETFEDVNVPDLPICWNKILRGATLSENSNVKTTNDARLPEVTKAVEMRNTSESATDDVILVTPNLSTLSSGAYRLRFIGKGFENSVLEFGTLSSFDENATFNPIEEPNFIIVSSTPTEYQVNFNGDYGADSYIGIRLATFSTGFVELDNIIWEPIPTCPDTTNLEFIESNTSSATIKWDANNATLWEVSVGSITDTEPIEPYTQTSDHFFYPINNLDSGISYNIWVRAVCENSEFGTWSNPIVVTTQCDATTVPYSQDFETATVPNLPECTSAKNYSEGPYNWYVENNPGYGFTSNTLTYDSDLFTDANAWFFTQGITLEAGVNYNIKFAYGGASTDTFFYNNSLKVMYGNQGTEFAMTNPLFNNSFFAVDEPVNESINFTPTSSGVYYFGFNVYSPNNSNFMFIDDIEIGPALSNSQFDKNNLSYYPNPVKNTLNISYINNISEVSVYNLLGQKVIAKAVNNNLAKLDLSALANGTYLVKVAAENMNTTIKIVKQ